MVVIVGRVVRSFGCGRIRSFFFMRVFIILGLVSIARECVLFFCILLFFFVGIGI